MNKTDPLSVSDLRPFFGFYGGKWRDVNLEMADGLKHYSICWHGHGELGRRMLAVDTGRELVFFCGCFSGTEEDLREYIEEREKEYAESRVRALEIILELHRETE